MSRKELKVYKCKKNLIVDPIEKKDTVVVFELLKEEYCYDIDTILIIFIFSRK